MSALPSFARTLGSSAQRTDARKAALVLHAIGESDRRWLLANLPVAQRALLEELLAELKQLGIPADAELVEEAITPIAAVDERPAPEPVASRLERADPTALVHLLSGEPTELIARLLHVRSWPWSDEVLAQLGEPKRTAIRSRLEQMRAEASSRAASTSLDASLLKHVQERLARPVPQPTSVTPFRQPTLRLYASAWARRWTKAA